MTFFDLLRSVFFYKNQNTITELDHDGNQSFIPFLLNRWLSFSDRNKAIFVNETFNKFTSLFEDKADAYKFYFNLTPRRSFQKIQYIKKNNEKKEVEDVNIGLFAVNNYISKREVNIYLALQKDLHT